MLRKLFFTMILFTLIFGSGCQKKGQEISLDIKEPSRAQDERETESEKRLEEKNDGKLEENYNPNLENPLTEEPGIVFSFDDRSVEDWYSLKELFKENGVRASFFVCKPQELTEKDFQMLAELEEDGHEIGAHSTNHLKLEEFLQDHSLEEYVKEEIDYCKNFLEEKGFKVDSYAFPFGVFTEELVQEVEQDFSSLRGTAYTSEEIRMKDLEKVYFTCGKNHSFLYGVGIDQVYENSLEEIKIALEKAKKEEKIIVFYSHHVLRDDLYTTKEETFKQIIEMGKELDLRFYTVRNLHGIK